MQRIQGRIYPGNPYYRLPALKRSFIRKAATPTPPKIVDFQRLHRRKMFFNIALALGVFWAVSEAFLAKMQRDNLDKKGFKLLPSRTGYLFSNKGKLFLRNHSGSHDLLYYAAEKRDWEIFTFHCNDDKLYRPTSHISEVRPFGQNHIVGFTTEMLPPYDPADTHTYFAQGFLIVCEPALRPSRNMNLAAKDKVPLKSETF